MPQPAHVPLRHGVVAVIRQGERFLVIERAAGIAAPGRHCFPGGGIEAGEAEDQALLRELQEELGVLVTPLSCVWRSVTRWQVALAWWEALLPPTATPLPNPAEVAAWAWLSEEQMRALPTLLESNREFLDALAAGAIALNDRGFFPRESGD